MKKQINLKIKAHLIRSAFYVLLLLAVCVIPFALAQRNSSKQIATNANAPTSKTLQNAPVSTAASANRPAVPNLPASQLPKATSGPAGAHAITVPPAPQAPQVILYDQYNNAAVNATSSQDFEASLDAFDDELADDFVVPGGQSWSVESIDADGVYFNGFGPAQSFNVRFYTNSGGLPGTLVESRIGMSYTQSVSTFSVTVSPAVCLASGTYWVSVQARQDFTPAGQWGWTDRTVQSNSAAAWQNPGGGFGVCTTWGQRGATCQIDPGVPDQVYRLIGTIGCGPTPTPTPTPTATCSPVALWYNGDFNGVNGLANEENTIVTQAAVYDDFVVPAPGWNITSVFSDNLMTTGEPIVGADWEIRQGISEGNGGTLIASGTTTTPVVTPTGRSGFGFTEYMVQVNGLNVDLAPGTYWLNVTPSDSGTGRSFDSTTSGANCVGTPCGNNQNAFFNSTFFGAFFTSTANEGQPYDFSMGVNGTIASSCSPTPTPTPTPGQIHLTAKGRLVDGSEVVRLRWTGANSPKVDIRRDGVKIATVQNTGSYTDTLTVHGTYTYQVCEKGTHNCSNEARIFFLP